MISSHPPSPPNFVPFEPLAGSEIVPPTLDPSEGVTDMAAHAQAQCELGENLARTHSAETQL